ncbi:MAG: cysteine desulfurase [Leptolinea sp.]|jgi:cysteine desulfurase|nr:cysteine desulfurase [Leptolinea sp.]
MNKPVYFDYAATTPVDENVLKTMLPFFSTDFGNPSSVHVWGQKAEAALELSRQVCAELLNTTINNILFTSGGSESDNLALRGSAFHRRKTRDADEIITTPVEHPAIGNTARQLRDEFGFKLILLPVDKYGMVDPEDVKRHLTKKTAIVSIIYGNNEIGTVNPIKEIGKRCQEMGIPFHSDAVQAAAHLHMDMQRDKLNLISIGAHKMYGPKGTGLLGMNATDELLPAQTGGGQEFHLRAGTQNIPLIIGLSEALSNAQKTVDQRNAKSIALRNRLIEQVLDEIPNAYLTGHPVNRLPNHASFVFDAIDGNRLLMLLDTRGFACSSGSACKVGSPNPSEVLLAMGYKPELALGSLRITLGKESTVEQVDDLVLAIIESIKRIRK